MIAYFFFHAIVYLFFFGGFSLIVWLLYLIPTVFDFPRVGKSLAGIVGVLFIAISIPVIFHDELFTKQDALNMLESQDIVLNDKFKIKHNRSEANIGDYSQTFTLKISASDKERIVNELISAKDINHNSHLLLDPSDKDDASKRIEIDDTETQYIIEISERPEGSFRTIYTTIKINKKNNLFFFEHVEC